MENGDNVLDDVNIQGIDHTEIFTGDGILWYNVVDSGNPIIQGVAI